MIWLHLGRNVQVQFFYMQHNSPIRKFPIIWELEKSADLLFHCFCAMITTANSKACLLIRR